MPAASRCAASPPCPTAGTPPAPTSSASVAEQPVRQREQPGTLRLELLRRQLGTRVHHSTLPSSGRGNAITLAPGGRGWRHIRSHGCPPKYPLRHTRPAVEDGAYHDQAGRGAGQLVRVRPAVAANSHTEVPAVVRVAAKVVREALRHRLRILHGERRPPHLAPAQPQRYRSALAIVLPPAKARERHE